MMKNLKIELNVLLFILIEAFFLLNFFQINLLNYMVGSLLGIISILLLKKIKISKIIIFLLLLSSIFLLLFTIKEVNLFITLNILRNYSPFIITFSFLLLTFFLANKGYHPYIRSLEIATYFFLFIKLFSLLLVIPNIQFNHFNTSFLHELKISYDFFFITITYLYLFFAIKYLTNQNVPLLGFSISSINPMIIKLLSISLLGRTLTYLYQYPYVSYLKRIKYFDFIERMEGILSFEYLLAFFFLTSFIMLVILTIAKSFSTKNLLLKLVKNKN